MLIAQSPNTLSPNTSTSRPGATLGFRIDVDIYAEETKPPVAQFRTLFTDSKSIEIDARGGRVTVLDYTDGTINSLDVSSRTMTSLEMTTIDKMLSEVLAQTRGSGNLVPARRNGNLLTISDAAVEYRVDVEKQDIPLMAVRYAEFADATTKLNAIFPPYRPPQLRLELNAVLRDARELPVVTRRITKANSGHEEIVARILIKTELDEGDQKDLQINQNRLDQFRLVPPSDFFGVK